MHTLKVAMLERPLGCETIDRWAEVTLPRVEPLRRRLASIGPAWPVWIDGGDTDLADHMRHVALDPPGAEEQLENLLSELCSGGLLERDRPLWRLWHVTGLARDRDAMVLQVHHVLADGNASVALWNAIADDSPKSSPESPTRSRVALAASAVGRGTRELGRLPSQLWRFRAYLRHVRALDESEEPSVVGAFLGPQTRFNGEPERRRRCAFATLSVSRLRAVRKSTGATLTEIFLTVCGGAVRRHLEDLGEPPAEALTATVPAALPERAEAYGNAVTTLYVSLHSDIVGPELRLEAVRQSFAATRRVSERDPRLLADWQRYPRLNRTIIRLMEMKERRDGRPAYNLTVSSVRGPEPLELSGVPVVELRSVGPLVGHFGLNITGWSYGDDFTVSFHSYASAGEGLERLGPLLVDELDELEHRTVGDAAL